jgi:hypothetical protein
MKRLFAAFAASALCLAFGSAAQAQQYKWVDQNGKVQYGDVPPPGVKAQRLKPPPGGAAPAPAAKKGDKPLSPEAAYRKRQEEAQKEREKGAQAEQEAAAKSENCTRAQESLRTLESGQRIARTDAKGERYYLEDAQIAQETARARQIVKDSCG